MVAGDLEKRCHDRDDEPETLVAFDLSAEMSNDLQVRVRRADDPRLFAFVELDGKLLALLPIG